jgi:hypothetical protein
MSWISFWPLKWVLGGGQGTCLVFTDLSNQQRSEAFDRYIDAVDKLVEWDQNILRRPSADAVVELGLS